jgi:metallo-beta-lactamase family protein
VEFGEVKQLSPELEFCFVHAAHILGSGMAEITLKQNGATRKLVFTGDIGRVRTSSTEPGRVVNIGPAAVGSADLLVMESTYGNRDHPHTDPRPELARLIRETVARGGSVIVPAFAVERTQKFVFMLKDLMERGDIPRVPVHTDSPMAIAAVKIFLKNADEFTPEARELVTKYGSPLTWPGFYFDQTPDESKKINASNFPLIIVSSSGMATGGRVLHHLAQRLPDPRNLVLLIGFQSPGTRGAIIKSGATSVRIFSEEVPIRAQVATLEQFSDHADTAELLEWLRTFKQPPATTYLVHGEPTASAQLQTAIKTALGWKVEIAQWMQKVTV